MQRLHVPIRNSYLFRHRKGSVVLGKKENGVLKGQRIYCTKQTYISKGQLPVFFSAIRES
jgi:hypothetical protein